MRPNLRIDKTFLLKWMLSNTVSTVIGFALSSFIFVFLLMLPLFNGEPTLIQLASKIGGVIYGATVGVGQWIVIRQYLRWHKWWIVATIIGWVIGGFVGTLFSTVSQVGLNPRTIEFWIVSGFWAGVFVGTLQWLVLKQHIHRSVLWIGGNILGWTSGNAIGFFLCFQVIKSSVVFSFGIPQGLIVSLITGFVLLHLMQNSKSQS